MDDYGLKLHVAHFSARGLSLNLAEVAKGIPPTAMCRYHHSIRRPTCMVGWVFEKKLYKMFFFKKGFVIVHEARGPGECDRLLTDFAGHLFLTPANFRHPEKLKTLTPETIFKEIKAVNLSYQVKFDDCPMFSPAKFRRLLLKFLRNKKKAASQTKSLVLLNWDDKTKWVKTGSMVFLFGDGEVKGIVLGLQDPAKILNFTHRVNCALMRGIKNEEKLPR
jgi:hypothetical protein